MNLFRFKKGFTLLELLVVISIIGMLSSIVLASTQKPKEKAVDSKINSLAREYINALELYNADHDGYPFDVSTASQGGTSGGGDANGDNFVNIEDLLVVITNWGHSCPIPGPLDCPGDVLASGEVDINDLQLVIQTWGWTSTACLGAGNDMSKCIFVGFVSGQSSTYPPENSTINNKIAQYISGPPASKEWIYSASGQQSYRGIVYICADYPLPATSDTVCSRYYLMWLQKSSSNCAGGLSASFYPDSQFYVCIYSNDSHILPSFPGN